ncbi:hypothetical protein [Kitasatospora sp. NPDC004531]
MDNGRLEVFVVATDRSLYVCEQKQPNSDTFGIWSYQQMFT